ncbi:glutathione-dependent formaldehyde-activating protein [Histoplasma capsulatum var. duboisii H88]|uniref:Glutathione-dependent formaldehyde-activating protein n=1 Tax=Ajellomyces capsulatus (strain H88) TaxID=544711 RepID=F0UJX2_AJEC8|nr:glutathione-dependent formaldehyde-activating protein [Histoplasma capsulatum var. duboisii H88]QSS57292.1 glutathione-dependent formaldehyde-activating protein [Histoplasma capsulatum var. duboisii H88]
MTTETAPSSSKKPYTGSCHCGFVKYTVNLDIRKLAPSRCNCSICLKNGSASIRAEAEEDITLLQPASLDELAEYSFGPKRVRHYFCKTCGVSCFIFGSHGDLRLWIVNGLTIDTDQGIDWSKIRLQYWNGRDEDWAKGPKNEPYPNGSW